MCRSLACGRKLDSARTPHTCLLYQPIEDSSLMTLLFQPQLCASLNSHKEVASMSPNKNSTGQRSAPVEPQMGDDEPHKGLAQLSHSRHPTYTFQPGPKLTFKVFTATVRLYFFHTPSYTSPYWPPPNLCFMVMSVRSISHLS